MADRASSVADVPARSVALPRPGLGGPRVAADAGAHLARVSAAEPPETSRIPDARWLETGDVARLLEVRPEAVREMAHAGVLPGIQSASGAWWFEPRTVREHIAYTCAHAPGRLADQLRSIALQVYEHAAELELGGACQCVTDPERPR